MKAYAEKCVPHGGRPWKGGARTFIHKGTNDVLRPEDCRRYDATAVQRLGRRCARWLAEGGPV